MSTFLLCNNPAMSSLDASEVSQKLRDGRSAQLGWSVYSYKLIKPGDEVFWLRLGGKGRGIFGRGRVKRGPYLGRKWNEDRQQKQVHYVDVDVLEMVDPDLSPLLSQQTLKKLWRKQQWSPQSSGIRVLDEVLPGLRKLWKRHYAQAQKHTRVLQSAQPTTDPKEFEKSVRRLRALDLLNEPLGVLKPEKVSTTVWRFARAPVVQERVLRKANGRCQCCRRPAPFVGDDGHPFLEVHHLKQLAHGGPDTVENAVAVCPNCHRELHHGKGRKGLTARLRKIIKQRPRTSS